VLTPADRDRGYVCDACADRCGTWVGLMLFLRNLYFRLIEWRNYEPPDYIRQRMW